VHHTTTELALLLLMSIWWLLTFASVLTFTVHAVPVQICHCAAPQGVAFEDVVMKVLTAGGPVTNASVQPEYVRLHDDKVRCMLI
jgi:hypothetical protein